MTNVAIKDIATQTTIDNDVTDEPDDEETSDSEDTEDNEDNEEIAPEKLLKPLEERKKAFLVESQHQPNFQQTTLGRSSSWKSMPSLNKTSPPLPLVGACYPSKAEDLNHQTIKQIKQVFENVNKNKSNFLAVLDSPRRRRSSSLTSVSSLSPASSTNESVIMEIQATVSKSTGGNPGNPVAVYRWDDESNGEIYTDRPTLDPDTTPNDVEDSPEASSLGLYVVENGKEYPLIPLRERKSIFEHHGSSSNLQQVTYKIATSAIAKTNNSNKQEPVKILEPMLDQAKVNIRRDPPVKASRVPYIQEEQEILQNIKVVSKIKPKFGNS